MNTNEPRSVGEQSSSLSYLRTILRATVGMVLLFCLFVFLLFYAVLKNVVTKSCNTNVRFFSGEMSTWPVFHTLEQFLAINLSSAIMILTDQTIELLLYLNLLLTC